MKRRLSREEAQVWARVAKTVTPIHPLEDPEKHAVEQIAAAPLPPKPKARKIGRVPAPLPAPASLAPKVRALDRHGLDASWDKKLAHGMVAPDYTLDLHGHSLEAAYARLDHGLSQALALGARVVLVITGRPRPTEAADRASRRGAIRAKLLDWLAAGPYGASIAAVRGAHRRHGGAGAVYVILRRRT
ncbi:Smr/MutS family protein [Novosphingobium sp.]|uniref:Smr/MutS family protein n=1 Tax=Novosphingobium sp. TaxID=1874826 RepID=UPI002869EDE2|nr:Smr/MutS family protein [Novosphingobium sp.]